MFSELQCDVCFRVYNAGRRCPRALRCLHTFCESCLRALARPDERAREAGRLRIPCPLCRHDTAVSREGNMRAELRVDEGVLVRLLEEGVLDREDDEDEDEDELSPVQEEEEEEEEAATPLDTQAQEGDSSAASRGSRLRRSCRRVWRVLSGKSSEQRSGCMSSEDLRSLAMMSCYMF